MLSFPRSCVSASDHSRSTRDELASASSLTSQQRLLHRSPWARAVVASGGPSTRGAGSQSPRAAGVRREPPSHTLGPPRYRAAHGWHKPALDKKPSVPSKTTSRSTKLEAVSISEDVESHEERKRAAVSVPDAAQEAAAVVRAKTESHTTTEASVSSDVRWPLAVSADRCASAEARDPTAGALTNSTAALATDRGVPAAPSRQQSELSTNAAASRRRCVSSVPAPPPRTLYERHSTKRTTTVARDDGSSDEDEVSQETSGEGRRAQRQEPKRPPLREEKGWIQRHLPYADLNDEDTDDGDDSHIAAKQERREKRQAHNVSSSCLSSGDDRVVSLDSFSPTESDDHAPRRHARAERRRHNSVHRLSNQQLIDRLQQLHESLPPARSAYVSRHRSLGDDAASEARSENALTCITVVVRSSDPSSSSTDHGHALIIRMYVETSSLADVTISDVKKEVESRLWIPTEKQRLRANDPFGIVLEDSLPLLFLPTDVSTPFLFMDPTSVGAATAAALADRGKQPPDSADKLDGVTSHSLSFRMHRTPIDRPAENRVEVNNDRQRHRQIESARALIQRALTLDVPSDHRESNGSRASLPMWDGEAEAMSPSWSRDVGKTKRDRDDLVEDANGRRVGVHLCSPRPSYNRLLRSPPRDSSFSNGQTDDRGHRRRHRRALPPTSFVSHTSGASPPTNDARHHRSHQHAQHDSRHPDGRVVDLFVGAENGISSDSSFATTSPSSSTSASSSLTMSNVSSIRPRTKMMSHSSLHQQHHQESAQRRTSDGANKSRRSVYEDVSSHYLAAHPLVLPQPPAVPVMERSAHTYTHRSHAASDLRCDGSASTNTTSVSVPINKMRREPNAAHTSEATEGEFSNEPHHSDRSSVVSSRAVAKPHRQRRRHRSHRHRSSETVPSEANTHTRTATRSKSRRRRRHSRPSQGDHRGRHQGEGSHVVAATIATTGALNASHAHTSHVYVDPSWNRSGGARAEDLESF